MEKKNEAIVLEWRKQKFTFTWIVFYSVFFDFIVYFTSFCSFLEYFSQLLLILIGCDDVITD